MLLFSCRTYPWPYYSPKVFYGLLNGDLLPSIKIMLFVKTVRCFWNPFLQHFKNTWSWGEGRNNPLAVNARVQFLAHKRTGFAQILRILGQWCLVGSEGGLHQKGVGGLIFQVLARIWASMERIVLSSQAALFQIIWHMGGAPVARGKRLLWWFLLCSGIKWKALSHEACMCNKCSSKPECYIHFFLESSCLGSIIAFPQIGFPLIVECDFSAPPHLLLQPKNAPQETSSGIGTPGIAWGGGHFGPSKEMGWKKVVLSCAPHESFWPPKSCGWSQP